MVSIHGLTYLKNIWDIKLLTSIIARLHGVKQKEKTYWSYIVKLAMLGILLSNHGYKARQAHYEER